MKTNQQIQSNGSTNEPVSSLYPDSCSAVSSVCVFYCQPAEEEENIPYLDTASTDSAQPRDGHTYTERRKESMNEVHIYVCLPVSIQNSKYTVLHIQSIMMLHTCVHIHVHTSTAC